jgi:hypothetical protein
VNRHERAYEEFLAENPQAWATFLYYATMSVAKKRPTSAKAIVERTRWDARMKWARDKSGFVWNNSYTAYLARDLMANVPGLFLETRRVRTA